MVCRAWSLVVCVVCVNSSSSVANSPTLSSDYNDDDEADDDDDNDSEIINLRMLTWNLSFGYGLGSEGPGHLTRPEAYFKWAIGSISDTIDRLDVDVAILQEVDFCSRRSSYMNQLDCIARHSGFSHRLPIVSWEHAYVPYPLDVLPQNHFGKMLSGGGVLSKHPVHSIANEFLPKPSENSRLFNHFFLHRYLQIFRVDLGGGTSLNCANLHLECFSENTRAQHLRQLMQSMSDYDLAIAGGDFNGPFALSEGAAATQFEINYSPLPSFPSENRSLDAWLTNRQRVTVKNVTTITSAGLVSDHCPVLIELEVRK